MISFLRCVKLAVAFIYPLNFNDNARKLDDAASTILILHIILVHIISFLIVGCYKKHTKPPKLTA